MRNKKIKQFMGLLSAATIAFSVVPSDVIAAETEPVTQESGLMQKFSSDSGQIVFEDTEILDSAECVGEKELVEQDQGLTENIETELDGVESEENSSDQDVVIEQTDAPEEQKDEIESDIESGQMLHESMSTVQETGRAAEQSQEDTGGARAFEPFSYTLKEVSLSQSSIGGVSTKTILAGTKSLIEKNEGNYDSVNPDDNGALSIGKMQWHGYRAARLLQAIISADNKTAYEKLGDTLYNEIIGLSTTSNNVWETRVLTSAESKKIGDLLKTEKSKEVQDTLQEYDISGYINRAYGLGLRDAAAVAYYTDVENQFGSGGAAGHVTYAERVAGSRDKITLNELHIAALCYNGSYNSRRFQSYGYVANLGWKGCPSADQQIPYGSPWSDGQGVTWLQQALNTYLHAGLTVDGQYGDATKAAVRTFQDGAGLSVDGQAGKDTISTLIRSMYRPMATGASDSVTTLIRTDIIQSGGKWIYVVNGKQDTSFTGVAKNANGWWYVKNGVVDFDYYGVAQNSNGWWRIEAGKVNFNFNGFAENSNGWWYLEGGQVQFGVTSVIQGTVKGTPGWWYVKEGKVTFARTVAQNSNGWWYIENGQVDFTHTGVEQNENGWWRIEAGKVNFNFDGFAENSNGWWYLTDGKVRFDVTGIVEGTVDGEAGSWKVQGGKVIV